MWPVPSTIADLLARIGLIHSRRPRRKPGQPGLVRPTTDAPTISGPTDFKGQLRTGGGRYCFPLTIADQYTRYLLTCRGLLST